VRAGTRILDADAGTNDHDRAAEPKHHRDAYVESITAAVGGAVSDRHLHALDRTRDSDGAGASVVLRGR
jgi:hypothetical protein